MNKPDQILVTNSFEDQLSSTELFEEFLHKCKLYGSPANEVELLIGKIRNKFVNLDPLYKSSNFFRIFLIEKVLPKIPREPWQGMKILSDDLKRHANENLQKEEKEIPPISEEKIHQQYVKELENQMTKILRKIRKLDKEEVDCSDEINSSYIRSSRYKKDFCKLYNRISRLKNETQTEKMITFSGTKIPALDKVIEQYCNSSKNFPDYDGIFKIIKVTSDEGNLGLPESQIHEIAENALKDLNCKMKTQRSYELHDMLSLYAESERWEDPALHDPQLERKLLENQKLHGHRLDEVINEYVKLEPHFSVCEEIDSEEEPSEDETLDADDTDETSAELSSIFDSENNSSNIVSIVKGISEIVLDGGKSDRLSASGVTNESPVQEECQNVGLDTREFDGSCCSKSLVITPKD